MIIITSEITISESKWQAAVDLAKSHAEQSRLKPGCISHRHLISPEKKNCMFFYEK
ncbi:MAG: hypothetical protein P8P54_11385 [Pseudomonadales bacterium]|nr:hypothetical protein [Pseudomonadales bacterium]